MSDTPQTLTVGTKIVDLDGFAGTIVKVTTWEGSTWYDVRFKGGTAVRYRGDVKKAGA